MLEDLDLGPRTSREVWTSCYISPFWDRVTPRLMEGPIEIVTTTTTACMGVDCMDHDQLHSPPTVSHQPT